MKLLKVVVISLLIVVVGGVSVLMNGLGADTAVLSAKDTAVSAGLPRPDGGFPQVTTSLVAGGFSRPVDIAHAGDNRLFVVEQAGFIRLIDDGSVGVEPFLDITDRVETMAEQGLLGLTFDPNYQDNGYFYVNYTYCTQPSCPDFGPTPNLYTRISRFAVTADPNVADPDSELILLEIQQPYGNHNGGALQFGPDGYLYIGLGDGGSGGDPQNRAQSMDVLLGKMLRLDVHGGGLPPDCGGGNYTIPPDNPFVGDQDNACHEIWASGLRNPWRFSFDHQTREMFIGDVGQLEWEEINLQPAGSGGMNWGWRCYEGTHPYNTDGCGPMADYDFPLFEYPHVEGNCAVTGGYIYRGSDYPVLEGIYFFGDYCSGGVWLARDGGLIGWQVEAVGTLPDISQISTFGEGCDGELYVADYGNGNPSGIYQIRPAAPPSGAPDGADAYSYLPLIMRPEGTPGPTPTPTATPPPSECK